MKNFQILFVLLVLGSFNTVKAQNNPFSLESMLQKKREYNKENYRNNRVLIYSGTEKEALQYYAAFKESFEHIPVQLIFITPNWKVITKSFPNKLEAERNFIKIQKIFSQAQLI